MTKSDFTIDSLLKPLGGRLIHGNSQVSFENFCIDSRYVDGRTLFVPLMGQNRDGHQFIIDSIGKGAVAAVVRAGHHQVHEIVEWLHAHHGHGVNIDMADVCIIEVRHTLVALQKLAEWFRMQFDATILGVTGSVGKTGTKEMLIQLLSSKYPTIGTEKNFNNEIGVPLALAKLTAQTRVAVIEMAMRARGEIGLLSRIAHPNLAVITNTSGSHVGRLGSFSEIYKAKSEIINGMLSPGKVVLNRNDPNVLKIIAEFEKKTEGPDELSKMFFDASAAYANCGLHQTLLPSISNGKPSELPEADIWLEDVELKGLAGASLVLCGKDEKVDVELTLLGRGAVDNFTAAAATAYQLGMTLDEIAAIAPSLLPVPQRLNLFQLEEQLYLIDDCYNSSPASANDSLEMMLSVDPKFRKIVVFGDMLELGKFETLLHRRCAQIALNLPIDAIYAVGPRMNAVNEIETDDNVELYYIEGHSSLGGFAGGRLPSHFGDPAGRGRGSRKPDSAILDDEAVRKLASMLLSDINSSDRPTVVLVKGSRGLHLERLVNDLLSGTV